MLQFFLEITKYFAKRTVIRDSLEVHGIKQVMKESWLQQYQQNWTIKKKAAFYTWSWYGVKNATASAFGLDRKAHFVNSYLVNYHPFDARYLWEPLYTLAMTKKYQYDHLQYSGILEVWQNSRQAFFFPRGDCEDHALILADWLISMGEDARVAVGKYKNGGHAWVILFKNGREYLLEATSKRKKKKDTFPLAVLQTDYKPNMMFNRTHFWFRHGKQTTKYSGKAWRVMSVFHPDS
ncbi:MAG: transglutaminase domain-containing protein [Desulfobacterales bacterium]|nr:transglutaminase domain-containing protein [Desulfobacterales bacterium]